MTKDEAIVKLTKDIWHFNSMTEFHNDRDVVLAAVKIYGFNLRYAADELKNDFDVVMAAVKQNGKSIQYASKELKNNKEIAIEALMNNKEAISYIGEDLGFHDEEFYKLWVEKRLKAKEREFPEAEQCERKEVVLDKVLEVNKWDINDLINESLKLSREFNVTQSDMLLILQILELRKQNKIKSK